MTTDREHGLDLLRRMVLIRRFEEKAAELYSLGKIRGFLHLYIGEEAVATGAMSALRPEDNVIATYREHGQALLRGASPASIMAEMFGKVTGCSRGRGGSMHLFDVAHRFYGGHAIVGGGLPVAVGMALADKLQGRAGATASFFGDGATEEGEFHESLNLAALWKLPVLFLCENNRYAMGTALERHAANTDLCARPRAYGIPAEVVDGMDVLAVERTVARALDAVLSTGSPYFVEAQTYRFRAHSMYDPDLYRSKEEVQRWAAEHDPIANHRGWLEQRGWLTDADIAGIERDVADVIERAVAEADAAPLETLAETLGGVMAPEASP